MANATRDDNNVPSLLGLSSVDFLSPVPIYANPSTHALLVSATIDTSLVATSANQTNGTQKTQIVNSTGTSVTVTGGKLDVNASIDTTGLALSNKQDTGNTSLASIDSKTPALGQAIATGSVPIVLTAAQLTTLTPLTSVTVTQATGTNLHTVIDSGTITTLTGITNQVDTNLKQVGGTNTVTGGVAGSIGVGGTVATNVAITANPLNLGAQAVSSENSAVTTARQVQLVADLVGKLIVLPYANPENFVSGVISSAMTGTTSTSLIGAPAGSLRNYITQITVSNSHATVGTDILIQDGNGGTTLYVIPAAAVYGGATLTFPTPLRQPTTATALYCANVTTGSSTKVSASGYKGL